MVIDVQMLRFALIVSIIWPRKIFGVVVQMDQSVVSATDVSLSQMSVRVN